ncbi:DUF2637 domain-containing protein [Streptomyces sp. NPDC051985]|uniref:DUF2637 domain-containing protein n=1 Tax=Streptomyces sp. NPDC051985 TaxID=3155807 RepID=UPI0034261DF7
MTGREGGGGHRVDGRGFDPEAGVRLLCALVVAGVAAYASYVHQRSFALQAGADPVSASLWPLSVDGLLLLATLGLLKPEDDDGHRARWAVRTAFLLGFAVSLAANVAAAPRLEWRSVLVAGWPPVALLLSVELLVHRVGGRRVEGAAWASDRDGAGVSGSDLDEDPLLVRARKLDLEHREMHQRPASAETLRKELHVGAQKSRTLVALVRGRKEQSEKGTKGHAE